MCLFDHPSNKCHVMQWAFSLAEKMNKVSHEMCLSQHVLDLILLKQQTDQNFFLLLRKL